jgi:uncharacterized repeat protein (TIGR01451 family)
MRSPDPTSQGGGHSGLGAAERFRSGLSRALLVVVQATFVASTVLLAPIAITSVGAAATSATLDQCANGPRSGPRLACLLSQWQNGNINGNNSQYSEGDSVPFRALIKVASAGTHNIWIQFDNTKASKHAYDYLTSWDATETGDPTSGTGVSNSSPSTLPITTPANVFCGSGFIGGPGVVAGSFTLYGGGLLTTMAYTTPAGTTGIPPNCTGDQSVTVQVTFTTTAGGDLVLAWGGHIASQQNWGVGTSAINISGSPYHQRIVQIDTTSIGNQDRSLKASAVLVPPVIVTQVSPGGSNPTVGSGQSVTDQVTVSGSAGTPSGTVAFFLCGPLASATGCPTGGTPAGSGISLNNAGQATSSAVNTSGSPLAAGTYCFRVEYTAASNSQYTNGSGTNTTTECFTVVPPSLTLTKVHDAVSVNAGSPIGFTITLANAGPGDATGAAISDNLPGGLSPFVHWVVASQSGGGGCAITGADGSQVLACGPITLTSGSSIVVHVTAATAFVNCGTYNNTANFTTTNDGSGPATASEDVNCPNLTLTKTADKTPVNLGDTIGFAISLSNAGPGAATGVTVHDPLPGGAGADWTIDTQTTPAGIDCVISGPVGTEVVDCGPTGFETTSFTLASGASVTFHVTSGTASAGACTTATLTNTVTVTGTNIAVSPLQATDFIVVNCPNVGLIAPTQTTCQLYASHQALPEAPLSYGVKDGKVNTVAPGVIFYFTTITVAANNTPVSVTNTASPAFPSIEIQNGQAFVFTTGCVKVATMTVNGGTASVTLNPGTYIIQIKYTPNSLVGTSVSGPPYPTFTYTFTTTVNGVIDNPSTATIQLIPK